MGFLTTHIFNFPSIVLMLMSDVFVRRIGVFKAKMANTGHPKDARVMFDYDFFPAVRLHSPDASSAWAHGLRMAGAGSNYLSCCNLPEGRGCLLALPYGGDQAPGQINGFCVCLLKNDGINRLGLMLQPP